MEGNPLATPPLADSIAYDLSIAHANCGLCTKQLNMNLVADKGRDLKLILKNLKKCKQHFEKSLHYSKFIDNSSGSSNRDHEGYVTSQVTAVVNEINQFEETRKENMKRQENERKEDEDLRQRSTKSPSVIKKKLLRKKKKKK